MKVVFVDNLLFEGDVSTPRFNIQPHLGLMSLVAVLRTRNVDAVIVDPKSALATGELTLDHTLASCCAARLASLHPDVVGFTALGCNFPFVVDVATALRRLCPHLPILLGGPHATILHREILQRVQCFDIIVRHEAEFILPQVIDALSGTGSLLTIPSISFRTRSGTLVTNGSVGIVEDLDSLPMPAYDAYPIAGMGLTELRIEAGRGCPFSCTFCSTATFFGRQYRLKSPERLCQEMTLLNTTYGITAFKLNHDLFTVNRHKVAAFCEAVARYGFTWSCSARVDCVDTALLETMQRAGCRHIYFGIETGSARMQDISRKKLDLSLVEPTLDVTERLQMATTTSFIAGYPEETHADQSQTLDAVGRLHLRAPRLNQAQLHLLTPEPGTALIDAFRNQLQFDDYVPEFSCPTLDGADALVKSSPDLFPNHFYFQCQLPRARNIGVTSLWTTLHELGPDIIAALLAPFDGRLSLLADAVMAWAAANHADTPAITLPRLRAFCSDRFGATSVLTSLLRFHAAQWRLARLPEPVPAPAAVPGPLALSDYAILLEDIHDLAPYVTAPAGGIAIVADNDAAMTHSLLLRDATGLRLFALDDDTAHWLRHLDQADAALMPEAGEIDTLVRMGVLMAAPGLTP